MDRVIVPRDATHLFRYTPKLLYFGANCHEDLHILSLIKNSMKHSYCITLNLRPGAIASTSALQAGSRAAEQVLSVFDAAMLRRLQPLAARRRSELEGTDYLDASVLEYALAKALEAAFPQTRGEPPSPLTRESFVLRITEEPSEVAEISAVHAEEPSYRAIL